MDEFIFMLSDAIAEQSQKLILPDGCRTDSDDLEEITTRRSQLCKLQLQDCFELLIARLHEAVRNENDQKAHEIANIIFTIQEIDPDSMYAN